MDVHLLGSLNPNDCIDRGHWDAGSLLAPGRYFVTVDTWVDGNGNEYDGPYGLRIGLTTVQDLQSWGMNASVAYDALHAFDEAWRRDEVDTTGYAVVDFNLHASQRRMWVFDVFDASLAYHTHTTVGEMSDPNIDGWATAFSNTSGSHQSSLGMMKGGELYSGNFGASMRLDGLEPGYNTNVRSRAIVMHPWNGSAPAYVAQNPGVGAYPTWGCLGMDPALANPIRQFLSGGGLVLSHFVDGNWSVNSSYLP
ncbi:MAG: murein L,D-transpeptidase catalytic domain-containing protein [Myxococcota bacterium]